jgi:hypothetical protein
MPSVMDILDAPSCCKTLMDIELESLDVVVKAGIPANVYSQQHNQEKAMHNIQSDCPIVLTHPSEFTTDGDEWTYPCHKS